LAQKKGQLRFFKPPHFGTPVALTGPEFFAVESRWNAAAGDLPARGLSVLMWPLVAYFALVLVLVTATLVVSYLLGPRHSEPATKEPYEGGIVSEGSARVRFSVRYYLVAMFFVVFDLEAVFLFAWAGAARELGWAGYYEVVLFIGVLGAALVYLWRVGALDWARKAHRSR
jgi:NADH-quinone oxidoreductase subunit A